jgi:hypothetical protein
MFPRDAQRDDFHAPDPLRRGYKTLESMCLCRQTLSSTLNSSTNGSVSRHEILQGGIANWHERNRSIDEQSRYTGPDFHRRGPFCLARVSHFSQKTGHIDFQLLHLYESLHGLPDDLSRWKYRPSPAASSYGISCHPHNHAGVHGRFISLVSEHLDHHEKHGPCFHFSGIGTWRLEKAKTKLVHCVSGYRSVVS